MKKNRLIILGVVIIALVAAVSGYFLSFSRKVVLDIGGRELKIEVVRTPWQLQKGLGGRESLVRNEGMLFVMPYRGNHNFWMKDVNFPLDIIWLDNGMVVDVVTLEPSKDGSEPESHKSASMADMVLELNAGMAEELGIKQGFRVKLPR